MNLKVWFGPTIWTAAKAMFSKIDHSDMNQEHIVVVPDRFSLLAEKLLLEFSCGALFNVSVMGISRLARYLLEKQGVQVETLSAGQALLLTEQAISEVCADFQYFKKSNIRFCNEMYKIISQFKSCNIQPEDLTLTKGSASLIAKYHDLQLIFAAYERLLAEKLDANSLLTAVLEGETEEKFKNLHIYFAGFDSFTEKVFAVMQRLQQVTGSVHIALAKPISHANSFVYENDIFEKLISLSKAQGLEVEAEEPVCQMSNPQLHILSNLYAKPLQKIENTTYYESFVAEDISGEVGFLAKRIRYEVYQGAKYGQMQIACSDLQRYAGVIKKIFTQLEIPFYMDQSITAQETVLAHCLDSLLEVIVTGYSYESLLSLFASPLLQHEMQEAFHLLQQYKIFSKQRYKRYLAAASGQVNEFLSRIENAKTYADYCIALLSIMKDLQANLDELDAKLEEKQYYREKNMQMQMVDLIAETCQTIINARGDKQCSASEFRKTLQLLLSYSNLSSVPAYADAVMIGDATNSFFCESEYLFLLGGQALPQQVGDTGIISDDDIASIQIHKKIEPSIRMINRRNRFKLFNVCTLAKNHLIVCYLSINSEGKKVECPSYIEDLNMMFQTDSLPIHALYSLNGLNDELDMQKFLLSIGNKSMALSEQLPFLTVRNSGSYIASLQAILKTDLSSFLMQRDWIQVNSEQLYFPKNYTKVTQLETYFDCPFKHFVRYGLRLQENEKTNFDGRDIGNLCHYMAELFVNENPKSLGSIVEVEIDRFLDLHLESAILKLKLVEKLETATDKAVVIAYLRRQIKFMLSRICEEQKYSQFKPLFTEKVVQNVSLDLGDGRCLPLQGKIDRIDVCDNYFRILDYKTGQIQPILKDLYYGDKLQLFLYEGFAATELGLTAAGAFYVDCRWDYDKPDEKDTILKGLLRNEATLPPLFDHRLLSGPSEIVAISPKAGGGYKGAALAKCGLSVYESYAKNVATVGLQEMVSGYTEPKPDADSCTNCAYQGICLYDNKQGFRRKGRIGDSQFIEGGKDE